ncbi:MAG: methionyl-tRNA formyltransferase [Crocinitomicaceae bacterium]|nr:methionyl-tRNA formyltransferase [Flavobacteriales bacterium]NQZ35199.1 methionyl-tRNA formyltransferase [Crocinitomicaceae bacterium]
MKKIDIVFMGTPEFAVTILAKLLSDEAINLVGVITAPDKPAGRGRKIQSSAVKDFAIEHSLTILQPTNLKDTDFINELSTLNADLFVVVAFRMLPEVVWGMPELGTINLHASLLPQYRGAAPINWAIINGEKETGVTTFFIERDIDTGAIIEQRKTKIGNNMTVGDLYKDLMDLGATTTLSTVHKIMDGEAEGLKQDEILSPSELKPAPKIFKADCQIDFSKNVALVNDFCRGLDPYPGAWSKVRTNKDELKTIKFFSTSRTEISVVAKNEFTSDELGILVPCDDCYLRVCEIQLEGKRKMNFKEFLAGHTISRFSL